MKLILIWCQYVARDFAAFRHSTEPFLAIIHVTIVPQKVVFPNQFDFCKHDNNKKTRSIIASSICLSHGMIHQHPSSHGTQVSDKLHVGELHLQPLEI